MSGWQRGDLIEFHTNISRARHDENEMTDLQAYFPRNPCHVRSQMGPKIRYSRFARWVQLLVLGYTLPCTNHLGAVLSHSADLTRPGVTNPRPVILQCILEAGVRCVSDLPGICLLELRRRTPSASKGHEPTTDKSPGDASVVAPEGEGREGKTVPGAGRTHHLP